MKLLKDTCYKEKHKNFLMVDFHSKFGQKLYILQFQDNLDIYLFFSKKFHKKLMTFFLENSNSFHYFFL